MALPSKSQASPRMLAAAAALAAGLVFLPALRNGFAYDDAITIASHPQVTGHAFGALWVSPYHVGRGIHASTGLYRPLTASTYALDHLIFGNAPAGYHATSLLLHALATALVVLVALRVGLSERAALVCGLVFGIHPVHVEAVAALAGRSDLMATVLVLAAALVVLREDGARVRAAAASVAFGLALFAKEAALPAALLLPVLPWVARRPSPSTRREVGRIAAGCASAAVVYLVARALVLGSLTLPAGAVTFYENPVFGQPPWTRLLTVLGLLARAAGLLVAPVRLSPDYGFAVVEPARGLTDPRALAGAAVLALLAAGFWRARRNPVAGYALLWCVATWAIVSNLLVVIGTPLAERMLYLPSVGFCMLVGIAFDGAVFRFGWRTASTVLATVATLALVRTTTWTRAWQDDRTLFAAAFGSAPRSIRVLGNLALDRADEGHLDEARALLERAVALAPGFAPNLVNLAAIQLDLRAFDDARRTAEAAVAADPLSAPAQAQLGLILAAAGELERAKAAFREALRIDPSFDDARRRLEDLERR